MIKSNRGYSLIEIGVGILILTVFLIYSIGMFNGCYNNYRRIKARNLALDRAVYHIENMLSMDSDELTGFFERTSLTEREPNEVFENFVYDGLRDALDEALNGEDDEVNYLSDALGRYASYVNEDIESLYISPVGSDTLRDYIEYDKEYLIDRYIQTEVSKSSENTELANKIASGQYAFLNESGKTDNIDVVLTNEMAFDNTDATNYIISNNGAVKVVKSVRRIPGEINTKAFGNNVLILKVNVYYTHEFKRNAKEEDMQVLTIETVKVAN